jgi:hypothetical protein
MSLPAPLHWLFWESAAERLDLETDADYVLARVLEFGRLEDVQWAWRTYGPERIHYFFRDVGHPELSPRTLAFWQAFFTAEQESWASPTSSRTISSVSSLS